MIGSVKLHLLSLSLVRKELSKSTPETCTTICLSILIDESELFKGEAENREIHLHRLLVRQEKIVKRFKCLIYNFN